MHRRPALLAAALLFACTGQKLEIGQQVAPIAFTPGPSAPVGVGPTSLLVSDLDQDGVLDVAVTNDGDSTLGVLRGRGGAIFDAQVALPTTAGPLGIAAADWNRDGVIDLACAGSRSLTLSLFYGQGGLAFAPRIDRPDANGPDWAFGGDFNADGVVDLGTFEAHGFTVAFGKGDGTFSGSFGDSVGPYASTPGAIGDFNRDGLPDFAVINQVSGDLYALGTQGSSMPPGQFQDHPYPGVAQPLGGDSLVAADIDGDGKLDLIATSYDAQGTVSALLGRGDGTFAPPRSFPASDRPSAIAVADFNLDGLLDLAVTNPTINQITVLAGQPNGTLAIEATIPLPGSPTAIGTGDFDQDGRPDLVVTIAAVGPGNLLVLIDTKALASEAADASLSDFATASPDGGAAPPGCQTGADCGPNQVCFQPCCDTPLFPCYVRPNTGCAPGDTATFSCNGVLGGCECTSGTGCPAAPSCTPPLAGRCIDLAVNCTGQLCSCLPSAGGPIEIGMACPTTGGECNPNDRVVACNCQH